MPGVDYTCVPLKIVTAQAEYIDDDTLDVRQMVDQIKVTKGKSGTSCPNIYQSFGAAERVFAVTITGNLSGSAASAKEAAAKLRELLLSHFPKSQVLLEPTTGLCSFYAEEGGLMIGFESV